MRLVGAFVLILLAACGTEDTSSLTRAVGECGDVEVHVIGVEQFVPDGGGTGSGDGSGSGSGGSSDDSVVILRRPGHHVLVLAGHKSVNWDVQVENGAVLDGVY